MNEKPRKKRRVVFLDIDGPVICNSLYCTDHMCSWDRSIMSTTAIGWLNRLCDVTKARVVTNSFHNWQPVKHPSGLDGNDAKEELRESLIRHGLKRGYLHDDWRTNYQASNFDERLTNRLDAIEQWLARYPEVTDWVAFDDERFTDLPNLVVVDPRDGITSQHFDLAAQHFGYKHDIKPNIL